MPTVRISKRRGKLVASSIWLPEKVNDAYEKKAKEKNRPKGALLVDVLVENVP